VDKKDITAGLRADGLSTMIGGFFNALPYTAFAQNVGLVAVTGVRTRWVVVASGGILIVLCLIPILGAFFEAIPKFIIGGAAFVMFATVAANGVKSLAKVDFKTKPSNLYVVAISIGIGLIPVLGTLTMGVPKEAMDLIAAQGTSTHGITYLFTFFEAIPDALEPVVGSSISLTAISAVLLNLFFNGVSKDKDVKVDMTAAH
jgi:NCS2 family nucleobase:cation symporter-2